MTEKEKMLLILQAAADNQHDNACYNGEIDCTDKTPCLFCTTISEIEGGEWHSFT